MYIGHPGYENALHADTPDLPIIRLRSAQNKIQRFPGHPLRAIDFSMFPLHIDFLLGEYEPTPPEEQSSGHGKDFGLGLALDSA